VHGMISALVAAGIEAGYLGNPRLARAHWQAGGRLLPTPRVSVAGESGLWVEPGEIPSAGFACPVSHFTAPAVRPRTK
jgi:hypothetical protein